MNRLHEAALFLIGLVCQALNNTNITGKYFNLRNSRRISFKLIGGAMAATKTTTIALYEATDADGTDSQAIADASAIITANTLVRKATIALASVGLADTVTINGVVFTQAAATSVEDREFLNAAGLVLCINSVVYGVAGVEASASTTNVTVYPADPGIHMEDTAITVVGADVGGTVTVATLEALAFVDFDSQFFSEGYSHVACKVTTTANTIICVEADGYDSRYMPDQVAAASATV